jgi:hypothetical protein
VNDTRERREFEHLVKGQFARLLDLVMARTTPAIRYEAARVALALCWRDRAMFQPPEESWLRWFESHLDEAVRWVATGGVQLHEDEVALLHWLDRDTAVKGVLWTTDPSRYDRAVAREKLGPATVTFTSYWFGKKKDCPPCWKCRWYDGWLPPSEPPVVEYMDPDITAACAAVDRKRVEIAKRVKEGA